MVSRVKAIQRHTKAYTRGAKTRLQAAKKIRAIRKRRIETDRRQGFPIPKGRYSVSH